MDTAVFVGTVDFGLQTERFLNFGSEKMLALTKTWAGRQREVSQQLECSKNKKESKQPMQRTCAEINNKQEMSHTN